MTLMSLWAEKVANNIATVHYPPRIPEFDDAIFKSLLTRFKNAHESYPQQNANGPTNMQPIFYPMPSYPQETRPRYNSESPQKRRSKKQRRDDPDTSVGDVSFASISSSDTHVDTSISPFRSYCRTIYKPGYAKWDNVFAVLDDGDVELDSFSKKMKPKELMQLCGSHMKEATAKRLIEAFKSWRKASKTA
jgi:hypothetical protein